MTRAAITMAFLFLSENLALFRKYPPPRSSLAFARSTSLSIGRGQKTLSPTSIRSDGSIVRAKARAMPTATTRAMPMDLTRVYWPIMSAPKPIMTVAPLVVMLSPAQVRLVLTASSLVLPRTRSSLYLDMMKMQ